MSQGSKYGEPEIKQALAAFVFAKGKKLPYGRFVEQHPEVIVPYNTAKSWAYSSKRDLYQQVKSELSGTAYGAIEDMSLGMAESAMELWMTAHQELTERLTPEEVKAMKTPDLLKVMHESAVSYDISLGKAMTIGGRPTQIHRMDFPDLQRALAERHGIKLSIEGEVVAEEDVPQLEPVSS